VTPPPDIAEEASNSVMPTIRSRSDGAAMCIDGTVPPDRQAVADQGASRGAGTVWCPSCLFWEAVRRQSDSLQGRLRVPASVTADMSVV
jgi:hypothetical protein